MLVYGARIDMDLCSIVFSRRLVLATAIQFSLHLRVDGSPQHGRDWLVTDIDVVKGSTRGPSEISADIKVRLLPLQSMGSKSMSLAHTHAKVCHQLALEAEYLYDASHKVYSVLTDAGTESGRLVTPMITSTGLAGGLTGLSADGAASSAVVPAINGTLSDVLDCVILCKQVRAQHFGTSFTTVFACSDMYGCIVDSHSLSVS